MDSGEKFFKKPEDPDPWRGTYTFRKKTKDTELNKPEERINLNIAEEIERIFVLISVLVGSVLFVGLLGILGYAVIIFLIKFVRSNLTL